MVTEKTRDREDEFFLKMDAGKIENLRGELDKKRKEKEKQTRQKTHWMKCPKCGADLEEINYQKVVIDKCPDCNGIWLDSGELELLTKGRAQFTEGILAKLLSRT